MIYLDNAATSWPKPESVYQTMDEFLRTKGGNPGRGSHSLAVAAKEVVEETRKLVAKLINAETNRVIFTLNCTDALNMGLKGMLKPGDHVITSCIGHNSLVRPLRKLERQGVRITRLPPSVQSGVLSARDLEEAIIKNTKLLVVTHASNVTGAIQPIEEYGEIAQRHNIILMVDAAQTAGKYPLDVQAGNIDLLAFSGHKGLLGPPGTGVLYVGERVDLDSLREGGTSSYSELEEQPLNLPYRYESGTVNSLGISGLGAGLKIIFSEGLERIRTHEQCLMDILVEGLSNVPGVALYKARDSSRQAPIISFNIEGYEPGEVGTILDQSFDIKVRAGLHCAPAAHRTLGTYPLGTVRLSPGYFNTVQDINLTLDAVGKIAETNINKFVAKKILITHSDQPVKITVESNLSIPNFDLNEREVETQSSTLSALLVELSDKHELSEVEFFDNEHVSLHPDYAVYINGWSYLKLANGLATPLKDGDKVGIYLNILPAGG